SKSLRARGVLCRTIRLSAFSRYIPAHNPLSALTSSTPPQSAHTGPPYYSRPPSCSLLRTHGKTDHPGPAQSSPNPPGSIAASPPPYYSQCGRDTVHSTSAKSRPCVPTRNTPYAAPRENSADCEPHRSTSSCAAPAVLAALQSSPVHPSRDETPEK